MRARPQPAMIGADHRAAEPQRHLCPAARDEAEQHAARDLRGKIAQRGQRATAESSTPAPRRARPRSRSTAVATAAAVAAFAAAIGLDLDIGAEAELGGQQQRLIQGRHPLAGKARAEPAPGIQFPNRRQ